MFLYAIITPVYFHLLQPTIGMICRLIMPANGFLKGLFMRKHFILPVIRMLFIGILTLTGCHFPQAAAPPSATPLAIAITPTRTLETRQPSATASITPSPTQTFTPTQTFIPTPSQTPTPTYTPSVTPTPTWVFNEPGQVVAPILLYHHIRGESSNTRFTVSIPDFRAQMQTLYDNGYTAITMDMLLDALIDGRDLPPKPVVITFDDGHQNVYDNAFPIMQEFNYPGVFYIVANRINNVQDFVNIDELQTMIDASWEIGGHSYTHSNLTKNRAAADYEIGQSKIDLQNALGVEITSFAYPFGAMDSFVAQKVNDYSYRAGIGLGLSKTHTWNNLFYLNRIEIHGYYSIETFVGLVIHD